MTALRHDFAVALDGETLAGQAADFKQLGDGEGIGERLWLAVDGDFHRRILLQQAAPDQHRGKAEGRRRHRQQGGEMERDAVHVTEPIFDQTVLNFTEQVNQEPIPQLVDVHVDTHVDAHAHADANTATESEDGVVAWNFMDKYFGVGKYYPIVKEIE